MGAVLQPGDLLRDGRYEIHALLRAASAKKVYRAHDRALNRQVALDVFSNNSIMPSGLTVSAWEAHVLGALGDHPNIATVLDHWEDSRMAAMVTYYLTGGSLEDLIARSHKASAAGLPIEDVFRLSIEIAYGLAHIHRCRLLYRDLQPHNVLFDEWGTIHLVDFDTAVSLDDRDMTDLSQREVITFTAPELLEVGEGDVRADLYSLGATIYNMVAGRPPFAGRREEILAARRPGRAPGLERSGLPEGLRDLVNCLLAADPDLRPTSADEVAGRLESLRAASANIELLLASNADREVLKTLESFLDTAEGAQFKSVLIPNVDLPPEHRLLMQAIVALAEADYRRAAIDAGTASEVALASAIYEVLQARGLNEEYIDHTIRTANGLEGLLGVYLSFGNTPPVSIGNVRANLAGVRNAAAHAGRIPEKEEAIKAVGIAHALVTAAHPFDR
jgi:serine/threonine protein kinase